MAGNTDARERADREALAAAQADNQRLRQRVLELEQANTRLVTLYVASHRLHDTLRAEEVFGAVAEIMATLLGSEEFAVYELCHGRPVLELASSLGVERDVHQSVALGAGLIGGTAGSGKPYRRSEGPEPTVSTERRLTACQPLSVGGVVTGVIAVFGLLSHKPGLTATDDDLLGILGTHVAAALLRSRTMGPIASS